MVGRIKTQWYIKVFPNWEDSCVKVAVVRESESSLDFSWRTSLTLVAKFPTMTLPKSYAEEFPGVFFITHDQFKQALLCNAPGQKQLDSLLFQVNIELTAHRKYGAIHLLESAKNWNLRVFVFFNLVLLCEICVFIGLVIFSKSYRDYLYSLMHYPLFYLFVFLAAILSYLYVKHIHAVWLQQRALPTNRPEAAGTVRS